MKKLTLDLHPIFRSDRDIDRALRRVMFEALRTRAEMVEIITGKGTGKLKTRVMAFLGQQQIKKMYQRAEIDPSNAGTVVVHFAHRE